MSNLLTSFIYLLPSLIQRAIHGLQTFSVQPSDSNGTTVYPIHSVQMLHITVIFSIIIKLLYTGPQQNATKSESSLCCHDNALNCFIPLKMLWAGRSGCTTKALDWRHFRKLQHKRHLSVQEARKC